MTQKACHHSLSWFHPKASWLWFFSPNVNLYWHQLLEGDEVGGVSGTNTRPSMLHGLIGDGELTQVVASHLWFDSHLVKVLPFYMPTTLPTILRRTIMSFRWVFPTLGISTDGASFFAFFRRFSAGSTTGAASSRWCTAAWTAHRACPALDPGPLWGRWT